MTFQRPRITHWRPSSPVIAPAPLARVMNDVRTGDDFGPVRSWNVEFAPHLRDAFTNVPGP